MLIYDMYCIAPSTFQLVILAVQMLHLFVDIPYIVAGLFAIISKFCGTDL